MITPAKRVRISDDIVEQLARMIVEGQSAPGERLPPERNLAEQFEVNRTSLREALRRLESLGLIRVRIGDGVYVEDFRSNATLDFVKFIMATGIGLDAAFVRDMTGMGKMFATEMFELAARNPDAGALEEMESLLEQFPGIRSPEFTMGEWQYKFWRALARCSGNQVFVYLMNTIGDVFWRLTVMDLEIEGDKGGVQETFDTYSKFVKVIKSGDPGKAVALITSRIKRIEKLMQEGA